MFQLIAKQAADVEELEESTQKLHWERRSLHNKLQDMKGKDLFQILFETFAFCTSIYRKHVKERSKCHHSIGV